MLQTDKHLKTFNHFLLPLLKRWNSTRQRQPSWIFVSKPHVHGIKSKILWAN